MLVVDSVILHLIALGRHYRQILDLYNTASQLSIDVAAGAAISSAFLGRVLGIHLRIYPVVILLLSVWIIYVGDHLLDVRGIGKGLLMPRRKIYLDHYWAIVVASATGLVLAGYLSLFLYPRVILGGVSLAILVSLYFPIKRIFPATKEPLCASLYCGGILLAPILNMDHSFTLNEIILIGQFILTVSLNLLIFSLFDYENDQIEGQKSFAIFFGKMITKQLIAVLVFLQSVLFLIPALVGSFNWAAYLVMLAMNLTLVSLFAFNGSDFAKNRFRQIGDAIFLLPLLYLVCQ